MRKILAFCVALSLCFQNAGVMAVSEGVSFEGYEYDTIIAGRNEEKQRKKAEGYSLRSIEAEIDRNVEKQLKKLSDFSTQSLIDDYGYTQEQAEILKTYEGGDLEKHPELRGVMGRLSGTITAHAYSKTSFTARFYWNWTTPPAYYVYEDKVVLAWEGTSLQTGSPVNVSMDRNGSSGTITYATIGGGTAYREAVVFENLDHYHNVEVPVQRMGSGLDQYAKTGNILLKVNAPINAQLSEASFGFSYAYKNSPILDISISYPSGVNIAIKGGGESAVYKSAKITYDGKIYV